MAPSWPVFASLGALLAPFWPHLTPCWPILAPSWLRLGHLRRHLGPSSVAIHFARWQPSFRPPLPQALDPGAGQGTRRLFTLVALLATKFLSPNANGRSRKRYREDSHDKTLDTQTKKYNYHPIWQHVYSQFLIKKYLFFRQTLDFLIF